MTAMQLTDEQFRQIMAAARPSTDGNRTGVGWQTVAVAAVALVVMLGGFALNAILARIDRQEETVDGIKRELTELRALEGEITGVKDTLRRIEAFMEKPRFTADDFAAKMAVVLPQIQRNTDGLHQRAGWMHETDKRLGEIDFRLRQIEGAEKTNNYRP